jgi:hypothetical protein
MIFPALAPNDAPTELRDRALDGLAANVTFRWQYTCTSRATARDVTAGDGRKAALFVIGHDVASVADLGRNIKQPLGKNHSWLRRGWSATASATPHIRIDVAQAVAMTAA